jgi:hypothetical protein
MGGVVLEQDERTIADLRRDVAEAHAITTRTHNALTTLATTLKEIVARQDRYERGLNLNSFVAYTLFTVLLGAGFYMLYSARAENLLADREQALRVRAEAVAETERARRELAARQLGSKKAEELWGLLAEGKRAEMMARLPEIAAFQMSPVEKQVLEQGAARARAEMTDASFAAGVDAVRGQQWKRRRPSSPRRSASRPRGRARCRWSTTSAWRCSSRAIPRRRCRTSRRRWPAASRRASAPMGASTWPRRSRGAAVGAGARRVPEVRRQPLEPSVGASRAADGPTDLAALARRHAVSVIRAASDGRAASRSGSCSRR